MMTSQMTSKMNISPSPMNLSRANAKTCLAFSPESKPLAAPLFCAEKSNDASVVQDLLEAGEKKLDRIALQKQFLNEPLGTFNGKPFTGQDFLELIQTLMGSNPQGLRRDYGHLSLAILFNTITIGIPLCSKSMRNEMKVLLSKGLPYSQLKPLLNNVETKEGSPLNVDAVLERAESLGLINNTRLPSDNHYFCIQLRPDALKYLAPKVVTSSLADASPLQEPASSTPASQSKNASESNGSPPPTLSGILNARIPK
jgi:hypothetical protein